MNRNELKTLFFQMDLSNVPVKKQIIVDYNNNPYWVGYGTIEILSEGPNGYSSFKTHQQFPFEYVKTRKEYQSGDYELIINGEKYDKLEMFNKKKIEIMIRKFTNNGEVTFLVIKFGSIVFKSKSKDECYEYIFTSM